MVEGAAAVLVVDSMGKVGEGVALDSNKESKSLEELPSKLPNKSVEAERGFGTEVTTGCTLGLTVWITSLRVSETLGPVDEVGAVAEEDPAGESVIMGREVRDSGIGFPSCVSRLFATVGLADAASVGVAAEGVPDDFD